MNILISRFKELVFNNYLILIFAVVIYVMHFLFLHGGYFGYDDIKYCQIAASWMQGDFSHGSLYEFRYGTILPLYLSYLIFGISDFANFFPFLIALLFILIAVLHALNDYLVYEKWGVALFLIFAPLHLMYVEKPMPDLLVELSFFLSFLTYFHVRFSPTEYKYSYIIWSIGIIIAFLSKETILVFYPYFLFLFTADFILKKNRTFWRKSVVVLSVFAIVYLMFNWVALGQPLSRVYKVFEGQYLSACSYYSLPLSALMSRITHELFYTFIRNLFLVPLGFVFLLFSGKDKKFRFVAWSFLGLVFLSNFMSISYTSYSPLCPDARHYMFLLPVGALLFGYGIHKISFASFRIFLLVFLTLSGMFLLSQHLKSENIGYFYIPLLAGICFAFYSKKSIMAVLFSVAFLSIFIHNALYNRELGYCKQKELNEYLINTIPGKKYIITDRVNIGYGMLHSQFDTTDISFIDLSTYQAEDLDKSIPQYLIDNGMTRYLSSLQWEALPDFAKTAQEKLPVIFKNEKGVIYKVN